jgi:hypothetical protein
LNTVAREGCTTAGTPARSNAKRRSSRVTTLTRDEDMRWESTSGQASLIQSKPLTFEWLSNGMTISVVVPRDDCAAANPALKTVRASKQISLLKIRFEEDDKANRL